MPVGDLFHDLHCDLVLVAGGVRVAVDGRHLVLGGGHLVVLSLGQDAELPQLIVEVLHIGGHAGSDRAKIVILQLLSPGRLCTKEGSAGHDQVFTLVVQFFVKQEVLLLGADLRDDAIGRLVAEKAEDAHGLLTDSVHGAQKRGLLVQGVSGVGAENRGNAKRFFFNKCK